MLTTLVENWPGFRDGIMGPDLMAEMRAQAERFGAEIIRGNVDVGRPDGAAVHGQDRATASITSRALDHRDRRVGAAARPAVRAGADRPRRLDLRDLRRLLLPRQADRRRRRRRLGDGRGDLPDRFASHVTVVHRRDTLRASKIMQDKAFANPKISFEWNTEVDDINDARQGRSDRRSCCATTQTGERKEIAGRRRVRRHRPHAEHGAVHGPDRDGSPTATS